jgi:predicted dehydrogenase
MSWRAPRVNKIRVAAVGLGWVALHRHLPVLDKSEDFTVVGVIDRASEAAKRVAAERGCRYFAETSRLEDVDWINSVDAVTVATAPMSRKNTWQQPRKLPQKQRRENPS